MKGAKVKAILIGLTAVLLISGVMGVAYATSNSVNNPHHEVDLRLRDQDEGWRDGVSVTWTATNMTPGDEFAFDESFVELRGKFPKKVDMGWVNIKCDYTVVEESPQTEADTDPRTDSHPGPDEMAKQMVITRCIYKFTHKKEVWQIDLLTGELTITLKKRDTILPINNNWQIQDAYPVDGRVTFYDLNRIPLTNLPLPRQGKEARFEMSVRFHEDAGNEFQGNTFNLTMIYTLSAP